LFEFFFKYPRELYARSSLIYTGPWPDWLWLALAAIAAGAIAWFLFTRRGSAGSAVLVAIGLLQMAMVALVLWLLALPAIETEELREGENAVALVLDTSSSMALGEGDTRIDAARRLLAQAVETTRELDFAVQRYEFDDEARPVENYTGSAALGLSSALGRSLKSVLQEARRSPLAGIIVASDGADTTGGLTTDELAELASFGVPVHTIAVGRVAIPDDLELTDVVLPAKVLPDSTVAARVSIRHDGAADTQLKVYSNDDLLASVPVTLAAGASNSSVMVDFELGAAGPHELEFIIDGVENELASGNNRRRSLIDVVDDTWRVLYFEGEPRWEYKFMRRAVNDDRDLRLESLLRVSPNKYYRQGIESPEQLEDGFPQTRAELYAYDALIIGSVEAATLTAEQQALVRDFVSERGGSLLMLGGRLGLGNGGWGQSLVADALPTRLPATEVDSFRRVQTPIALSLQGAEDAMLRFSGDDDENRRLWAGLPAVADYQLVGELKPAAVPLLNADSGTELTPLLVVQNYGRGKTYVLATGGTWRWQMSLPVEDLRHEMFWRQLLRNLVSGTPTATSLTATPLPGGGIGLRAEFRDAAFAPLGDIDASAVVAADDGDSWTVGLQASATEPGVYLGRIDPGRSGTFYAEAVAARSDEPVATARASLAYEAGQSEQFGIRSNRALLERLSAATGGRLLAPDELERLPDILRYSSAGITETEVRSIWDMPAAFLLLLLLKTGEWLLRRRRGSI
jgi:uncharacterized membrane protein